MKNFFHKFVAYAALTLVSSIPLSDVMEYETKQSAFYCISREPDPFE